MATKYKLRTTGQFKQELKRCKKRGLPLNDLWSVVEKLLNGEQLPESYHAHTLVGDRKGQWECHIQPDWLLIWEIHNDELVLVLIDTGSHSELFDKKYKK
ncbi:MAG: type II toxin-antitoxin system YafQ family toxin [Bacteroidales bacterium]|nr:type II toxin-antitoxin system YafQ family toxin [Bacteroidales bacterium]